MTKTLEVPFEAFCYMAHELAMETDEHHLHIPKDVVEEFYDKIGPHAIERTEILDDETIILHGEVTVSEVVDYIPASGGGKLEPPTNPPEYVTEELDILYSLEFYMDGLGSVVLHAEVA